MSCENNQCGTGDYDGPKPGDPNNLISLSANVVYGGINVSWSYPTLNPHAVAHTILYRGTTDVFADAIQLCIVAGSVFFDSIDSPTPVTYYYWIRIVSVNGTTADPVGPASTTSVPRVQQTLESLTGLIDAGVLAQALKTSIGEITLADVKITEEIENRIASNVALAALLSAAQGAVNQAMTLVQSEVTQRTEGDAAFVNAHNTLATTVGTNYALFLNEKTLRTTKDESYLNNFTSLSTQVGANYAAFIQEQTLRTTKDESYLNSIEGLSTQVGQNYTQFTDEKTLRTNKDSAYGISFQQLFAGVGSNTAAIQTVSTARVNGDAALAQQITNVQSALNGNIAAVELSASTSITTLNGKVTEIGALYTAKVSVNGLIGGFGIYNNGQEVDAGFDVDRFWVGRTGPDKVKPFIIDNGIVYIDKARIRNADIDTLKIAGNAVTVPVAATAYGVTNGNGNWEAVATVQIFLSESGFVYASSTGLIAYGTGWGAASTRLEINGQVVSYGGGTEGWVNACHSGGLFCSAGTVTATLYFNGTASKNRIIDPTIFMMGVKR